jgi:D-alanyl-D-alanine carboxypeptidase
MCMLMGGGHAFAERAALLIDADSGAVLHARKAKLQSFPASLVKLMTVYLLLEAIESKQMALEDKLIVSQTAARQPPARLGLRKGWTITLREVMLAIIIRSANDAAVVAAEGLAGSEPVFVERMNSKARALGMSDTVFHNATGLPDRGQITTARDIVVLAQALLINFPKHFEMFSTHSFSYRGKAYKTHNDFVTGFDGANGLKTGFTCHAGYNLVASAERNGRRLIGVILGERNPGRRNARMTKLLNKAFAHENTSEKLPTLYDLMDASKTIADDKLNKQPIADVCNVKAPPRQVKRPLGWSLVVGVRKYKQQALALASETIHQYPNILKDSRPMAIPFIRGVLLNRAIIVGLNEDNAIAACRQIRSRKTYCVVINPKLTRIWVEEGKIALKRAQALRNDPS